MCNKYHIKPSIVNLDTDYIIKYYPEKRGEFIVDRTSDHIVSNAKLKALTKMKDKYTIEEGIYKTINFYETNNYFLGIDYEYDGKLDRMINDSGKWHKRLKFIHYNNSSWKNKYQYYKGYYYDSSVFIILKKVIDLRLRIIRKIKSYFE